MAPSTSMVLLLASLMLRSVHVSSETTQRWQHGALVRLGSEAVLAVDTENNEEKDVALTLLHKWGLGSERQVMELAGKGPGCWARGLSLLSQTAVTIPPKVLATDCVNGWTYYCTRSEVIRSSRGAVVIS